MHSHTSFPSLYGKGVGGTCLFYTSETSLSTTLSRIATSPGHTHQHHMCLQTNTHRSIKDDTILFFFPPHPLTGQANHTPSLQSSGFCLDYSTALQPLQPSSCPYALCLRLRKRAVSLENVLDLREVRHKIAGMD